MTSAKRSRTAAVALAAMGLVLLWAARAVAATVSVTDLTAPDGIVIGAQVREAVLGIDMTGSGTFQGVSVVLENVGEDTDFDLTTLSDLQGSPDGVAVYRDDSRTGANEDVLDAGDDRVSSGFTNSAGSVDVTVSSSIPAEAEGDHTYFLVVETSSSIETGDDFTVAISGGLCPFDTDPATLLCSGGETQTITADADIPTATLVGTPSTVDGDIVWQFSENVIGVSEDNVVLRVVPSTPVAATVTYDAGLKRATINPDGQLTPGVQYVSMVNPDGETDLVHDAAGNTVPETGEFVMLGQIGFTPGIVRDAVWFLNNDFDNLHNVAPFTYGGATDVPVAGDWDGDGVTSPGVVRGNMWYLTNSLDGSRDIPGFAFGRPTDIPVVGDWDGDGDWTIGMVRGNTWFLSNELNGVQDVAAFGLGRPTDIPVVGDWDDDDGGPLGTMTPGVVRGNVWYLSNDLDNDHDIAPFGYGRSTDRPIPGDWDGDGKTTPGIVRGNLWFLNNSQDPFHDIGPIGYGRTTDRPVAGDWDGSID